MEVSDELAGLLKRCIENHVLEPKCHFLGEGKIESQQVANDVLRVIHAASGDWLFRRTEAVPRTPVIEKLAEFLVRIRPCYGTRIAEVYFKVACAILTHAAFAPSPEDMERVSLCSGHIEIRDSIRPLPARVSGLLELTASVGVSDLRIPLLTDAVPECIKFHGPDTFKRFVDRVKDRGQLAQFHAYLTLQGRGKGMGELLESAIASPSLALATALLIMPNAPVVDVLVVLIHAGVLPHVLRCLAHTARAFVLGGRSVLQAEVTALVNIMAASTEWSSVVGTSQIEGTIGSVMGSIMVSDAPLMRYVQKFVFDLLASAEGSDDFLVAAFLELVVFPFAVKFKQVQQLRLYKQRILGGLEGDARRGILRVVGHMRGQWAPLPSVAQPNHEQLVRLYGMCVAQVKTVMALVLVLGSRAHFLAPPVQAVLGELGLSS